MQTSETSKSDTLLQSEETPVRNNDGRSVKKTADMRTYRKEWRSKLTQEQRERYRQKRRAWMATPEAREKKRIADKRYKESRTSERILKDRIRRSAYSRAIAPERRATRLRYQLQYQKMRMKTDPLYAMKRRIRSMIAITIRRQTKQRKGNRTAVIIGMPVEEFLRFIESQFLQGMTWENRDKWHIDHIIPVAHFDGTANAMLVCNHYSNLRPFWKVDNQRRSDNYTLEDWQFVISRAPAEHLPILNQLRPV